MCVCVCACVRARVRACVRACVYVCVRARVYVHDEMSVLILRFSKRSLKEMGRHK